LRLVPAEPRIGGTGLVGEHPSGGLQDKDPKGTLRKEVWLTEEEAQLVQRFDPSGQQDTIGFFVAAFEKTQQLESLPTVHA